MLGAMPPDLNAFIAGLPKAELHVHHVGSASPRIVAELAARHRERCRATPTRSRDYFAFRDFAHFIEVYLAVVDLIRTPEDVRLLTYEVARELAEAAGPVRRADLHAVHLGAPRACPIEALCEAIEDARVAAERDFGIVLRWFFDIPGEAGLPAAEATLDRARPPARRAGRLRARRARGRRAAAAVQAVLRRGPRGRAAQRAARRRDHRAGDDLGRAATSSAPSGSATAPPRPRTRAAGPPGRAPDPAGGLPDLQRRDPRGRHARRAPAARRSSRPGVPVTINSDDPPMFGTTLNQEYEVAADLLDLDEAGVADLARDRRASVVRAGRRQDADPRRDRRDRSTPALVEPQRAPRWLSLSKPKALEVSYLPGPPHLYDARERPHGIDTHSAALTHLGSWDE